MKSAVNRTKYTAVKVNDRKKRGTWIMDPKVCVIQLLNQRTCIPILVFRHCPFSHAILQCSECLLCIYILLMFLLAALYKETAELHLFITDFSDVT